MDSKRIFALFAAFCACLAFGAQGRKFFPETPSNFPDGTPVSGWFFNTDKPSPDDFPRKYDVSHFGVKPDSPELQTAAIQSVIDKAAAEGGGLVVFSKGVYNTGALFFPKGVSLYVDTDATIRGSDDISDYPIKTTRAEGQTIPYFCALINADNASGFKIFGRGTIDGNGARFWRDLWLRLKVRPQGRNLDTLRPRLLYVSNSDDVAIADTTFKNSGFWTTHFYKCSRVKILSAKMIAPTKGALKAPSYDAIDLDVCSDVLIDGCYISVNDDGVVLKGGKGTFADKDPTNGSNFDIIVRNCTFVDVHSALTFGSESVHCRNVIFQDCTVDGAWRLLYFKMRPDTPQRYEYVEVARINGNVSGGVIHLRPWTQYYEKADRADMPISVCENVRLLAVALDCGTFFSVEKSDKYRLKNFKIQNCTFREKKSGLQNRDAVDGLEFENVYINAHPVK